MKFLNDHIKPAAWPLLIILFTTAISAVNAGVPTNPWSAIEITGPVGKDLDSNILLNIAKENGLPSSSVYTWKNHLAVYGQLLTMPGLLKAIETDYSGCKVKVYQNPFYDFDKRRHCDNKNISSQWDNILLTANMVENPKLQQEYLYYHATQFKKWPEVANGFCNADFQQLLVFKNGRQLLLVISIPKGANFEKLNLKTTEHNPRVNDWNKLMKKYQEGVPGTKPGEVWVFFKPLGHNR